MWVVVASVLRNGVTCQVPTFFLDKNIQGIVDAAGAEEVVKDILNPLGDSEVITSIHVKEVY